MDRPDLRASDAPITIVSGLPRSGTSLMMQMLAAAGVPTLVDDVRPPDPSNPRGYFELEAVKATRRDAGWVERAPGHAVKVIHALLAALPDDRRYRVILMERDVAQVVASQETMLAELGRAEGPTPPRERLVEIFSGQLDEARALLDREARFEWIAIDYPRLVADPIEAARRVIDFLDLAIEPESMADVIEPALFRQRG